MERNISQGDWEFKPSLGYICFREPEREGEREENRMIFLKGNS